MSHADGDSAGSERDPLIVGINSPRHVCKSCGAHIDIENQVEKPRGICSRISIACADDCRVGCCTWKRFALTLVALILAAGVGVLVVWFGFISKAYSPHYTPTVRNPPTSPRANSTCLNSTSIRIDWTVPDARGSAITSYELTIDNSTTPSGNVHVLAYRGPRTTYTVGGLLGNRTYCFTVRAVNAVGPGDYSNATCATTQLPGLPLAPVSLRPIATNETSLAVAWDAADGRGAPISEYQVQRESDPSSGNFVDAGSTSALVLVVGGLKVGAAYALRVRAITYAGSSNWSAMTTLHTDMVDAAMPDAPTAPDVSNVTPGTVLFAWNSTGDGGAEIIDYVLNVTASAWGLTLSSPGSGSPPSVRNPAVSGNVGHVRRSLLGDDAAQYTGYPSHVLIAGFKSNTTYCARATAVNGKGESAPSNATCFRTDAAVVPSPMLPPDLSVGGTSSLSVHWDAPVDDGGSPITAYRLQADDWWSDTPLSDVYVGLLRDFVDDGRGVQLLPDSAYSFRVAASNAVGEGMFSDAVAFRTDANGACGNSADLGVFKSARDTMKSTIQGCLIKNILSEAKAVDCIAASLGISHVCAQCWGDEGECTLSKCALKCINPSSSECAACSQEECFPDCVLCSGVPSWAYPP
eukprot:Opistho-2@53347